ncbi:hypothetical protein BDF14DRAFT_1839907 [Spinellus fusiger]|nr:hypothetical protein BDF14DRAFT_1839907 [Spinellus fusiger]
MHQREPVQSIRLFLFIYFKYLSVSFAVNTVFYKHSSSCLWSIHFLCISLHYGR